MTKGCKIWLWILLIGGGISVLSGMVVMSDSASSGIFTVVVGLAQMGGIGLMLFKREKKGFYIQCSASVIAFLLNMTKNVNFFVALSSAIVAPAITYYIVFYKKGIAEENDTLVCATTSTKHASNDFSVDSTFPNEEHDCTEKKKTVYSSSNSSTSNAAFTSSQTSDTYSKSDASKNMNNSSEKSFAFGTAKNMDITVDLYKELEIDRAWDEKTIRNHLKGLQKLWTQRQGATNDKEQSLLIDKILKLVEDGYRYLTKVLKRQQYDKALENAYKAGKIVDEAEEKLHSLLDQARAYYRKGNIQLATKLAQEAVEGKVNDPSAYDLLARCYFETDAYEKAINIVDQGLNIFGNNINLHWLGARIATVGTKNYEDAQRRVNDLIALDPEKSIGYSEQVYLYLRKGDEALAFQEIDDYIEKHPSDNDFKRGVAYDLDNYSNTCYYYDAAQNASFIADKEAYDRCLKLRIKAVEIYNDEHTQNQVERAKFYGQKKWNDWNMPAIKSLATYGTIFVALDLLANSGVFYAIGFALYAIMGVLIYFSFRPYWQINKTYVTGQMGTAEQIINRAGEIAANTAVLGFQALMKTVGLIFKFIIALASGKWF